MNFEQQIQQWITIDNQMKIVGDKMKELRDKKIIISTGGGVILRNQKILKKTYNIYLECNANTLVKRLSSSKERPLIGGNIVKNVNQLLFEREILYKTISNAIVDSNKTKKNIIDQIQEIITHENYK